MRPDGRGNGDLRPFSVEVGFVRQAEGSALVRAGGTIVLCNASVVDTVPDFLVGKGRGWVTAEYAMLPRATDRRESREGRKGGGAGGRTMEIQRLVGRALRGVVRLADLGERSVFLDCDVLQADAGTRTASITGAFIALALALDGLRKKGQLPGRPLRDTVAAVSVGLVDGEARLDLDYREDQRAGVDMNVVMTGKGSLVEVQGTAEGEPFARERLLELLDLAAAGIGKLGDQQKKTLGSAGVDLGPLLAT
jgi:ribonuclease PH